MMMVRMMASLGKAPPKGNVELLGHEVLFSCFVRFRQLQLQLNVADVPHFEFHGNVEDALLVLNNVGLSITFLEHDSKLLGYAGLFLRSLAKACNDDLTKLTPDNLSFVLLVDLHIQLSEHLIVSNDQIMALAMLMLVDIDDIFQRLLLTRSEFCASGHCDSLHNGEESGSTIDDKGVIFTQHSLANSRSTVETIPSFCCFGRFPVECAANDQALEHALMLFRKD